MWMLLLVISHIFYNVTRKDVNRHFQICPMNQVEKLLLNQYQAPELGPAWQQSLQDLAQSQSTNRSSQQFLYSCFDSGDYVGRISQEVGVFDYGYSDSYTPVNPLYGRTGILFWWAYVALAALTLFDIKNQGQLPKIAHKELFTWRQFLLEIFVTDDFQLRENSELYKR